ncbi:MAG TPA: ABC transporter permease [Candidatus Korarchaeota archaeon]|nr:ABC transporter permease [Candidatus Korarchaeota archaeon]
MRFRDITRFSFKAMMSRRKRATLTLLGIFLGVLTLTAVISFATGYGFALKDIFKGSSMRLIYLSARERSFNDLDVSKIESMDGVEAVMPLIRIPMNLTIFGKTKTYVVMGVDMDYVEDVFPDIELMYGDWPPNPKEEAVVLGSKLLEEIPPEEMEDMIGLNVKFSFGNILTTRPRIYGILAPYGTSIIADVDRSVLAPLDYATRLYVKLVGEKSYTFLAIVAEDVNSVDYVVDQLSEEYGDMAFPIAMKDVQKQLDMVVNLSLLVLGAIAAMTIVVASIGIMNAMYTAVTERTRIIGVMRAMGASQRDIAMSFLFEGILMSGIAIISGMILGYGASLLLAMIMGPGRTEGPHAATFSITPALLPEHAAAIAGITLLITILGALPPALQAARLEPAKALRFE